MTIYFSVKLDISKPEVICMFIAADGSFVCHTYEDWQDALSSLNFIDSDKLFVKVDYLG